MIFGEFSILNVRCACRLHICDFSLFLSFLLDYIACIVEIVTRLFAEVL